MQQLAWQMVAVQVAATNMFVVCVKLLELSMALSVDPTLQAS